MDKINDKVMEQIRLDYPVMNLILLNVGYDGKAIQAEIWKAFREIQRIRKYASEKGAN